MKHTKQHQSFLSIPVSSSSSASSSSSLSFSCSAWQAYALFNPLNKRIKAGRICPATWFKTCGICSRSIRAHKPSTHIFLSWSLQNRRVKKLQVLSWFTSRSYTGVSQRIISKSGNTYPRKQSTSLSHCVMKWLVTGSTLLGKRRFSNVFNNKWGL